MNPADNRKQRKIRAGDIKVFEDLFHTHYSGMCSYAANLVIKKDVAEEIVQDVFCNIWKNRNEISINISWKSYLYRSVFNNAMMYLRKVKKEVALDQKWAANTLNSEEESNTEIEFSELKSLIIYTLQQLPEKTRLIFHLSRNENLKYREIAAKLSISEKTVEANMGKALKSLRSALENYRKTA